MYEKIINCFYNFDFAGEGENISQIATSGSKIKLSSSPGKIIYSKNKTRKTSTVHTE